MKKIIAAGILIIAACINTNGQDTSGLKNKKPSPYVQKYGPYTVTMEDNKIISVVKDPKFDWSKVLKRDTATHSIAHGTTEIYTSNADTPVVKKYLIYDLNSEASGYTMSRKERMAKYHSRAGVDVVRLKPGVVLLNAADLIKKFNISKKNANLPLYLDFHPVSSRDSLLAVPEEVLKIDVIRDTDGFRFLNITTKAGDAERKKNTGKDIIYIR